MDGEDFTMPSPKRQKTNSPEPNHPTLEPSSTNNGADTQNKPTDVREADSQIKLNSEAAVQDQNEILDALMQHVEAEVIPPPASSTTYGFPVDGHKVSAVNPGTLQPVEGESDNQAVHQLHETNDKSPEGTHSHVAVGEVKATSAATEDQMVQEPSTSTEKDGTIQTEPTLQEQAALQVDAIPPTEAIEPAEGAGEPEWEVDSSPYNSSSDSDSTDSSDDSDEDDEDADGDYAMLDPEEAARILMQGDAGSDDEGDRSKTKGEGSGLRTANEQTEDVPAIPDITITEEMKIEELGSVEAVVENNVLIKGKVSGEYQVLESGSLLCLQDRTIAGVVAEPLGRVEQPLYTVRFRNQEAIKERGISEKGTIVYYVPEHSTFVFTQPLKAFKGSDASNFHDEEVGDEEMEFSDDEAEAEHKRQLKLKRQGRSGDSTRGRGSGKGGRGGQRGGYKPSPLSSDTNGAAYGNGSLEMNYDDVEEGEDGYTPLARPTNLHEMSGLNQAPEVSNPSHMPPPPYQDRGDRGRGHHRGGRGRDRGSRGGRGNHRGNYNNENRGGSYQQNHNHNNHHQPPHSNSHPNQFPPYSQPPSAPTLTPQNAAYPYSVTTSPISPLPQSGFNFNAGFPAPQNFSPNIQQQYPQWPQQMPGGFAAQFNNPAFMQFAQQFQQSQQHHQRAQQHHQQAQQHHQQVQQHHQQSNGWQVNQAAAAEVQRQLEEMRRFQNGGQQ